MRTILIVAPMLLAACSVNGKPPTVHQASLESATIVGSAQTPDPVLARVMELKKSGVVKDVVVQESFPVQIRLRAPRNVIDELNGMPRSGGLR